MQVFMIATGLGLMAASAVAASPVHEAPAPVREAPQLAELTQPVRLYDSAPWWMRTPIIAATGEVRTRILANRAWFSAQFSEVDPSLAAATKQVSDRVRALAKTLQAYGADKAEVQASLSITPIYQQYRDKQGELQNNERADRIERYQASVRFSVQVHDLSVLERAYAATVSAHPASIQPVAFTLEPDNETNTQLFKAATADAARRARLAAESTGARLGGVMLIDPTSRACETDVLVAGAQPGEGEDAGGTSEVMVTGQRQRVASPAMAPAPPPPAPGEEVAPSDILPVQPPLETLQRNVCVVYRLE